MCSKAWLFTLERFTFSWWYSTDLSNVQSVVHICSLSYSHNIASLEFIKMGQLTQFHILANTDFLLAFGAWPNIYIYTRAAWLIIKRLQFQFKRPLDLILLKITIFPVCLTFDKRFVCLCCCAEPARAVLNHNSYFLCNKYSHKYRDASLNLGHKHWCLQ